MYHELDAVSMEIWLLPVDGNNCCSITTLAQKRLKMIALQTD